MQQVREATKVLFPMAKGKSDYDDFVVISMLDQMLDAQLNPMQVTSQIEQEV